MYSNLSIYLYIVVAICLVAGQEYTSAMDNICDKTGRCKYMVEKMKNSWKKSYPLPRTYRIYILRPRWPFFVERAGYLQKSKRDTNWTRL